MPLSRQPEGRADTDKRVFLTLENVKGIVIGYRFPDIFSIVQLAGLHIHFICEYKTTS